jgi:hypothetical protein
MTANPLERTPIEDPLAELERQLIDAYLAGAGMGVDYYTLVSRHDDAARRLLAEAARYASERLSEIESKLHYLHKLHGEP